MCEQCRLNESNESRLSGHLARRDAVVRRPQPRFDAPSHAPHHLSAFDPDDGTLFAGGTASATFFDDVPPVTPLPDCHLEDSLETPRRLRERDPERIWYCHFGMTEDGTDALEAFEPILSKWVDAVTAADEAREEGQALSAYLEAAGGIRRS